MRPSIVKWVAPDQQDLCIQAYPHLARRESYKMQPLLPWGKQRQWSHTMSQHPHAGCREVGAGAEGTQRGRWLSKGPEGREERAQTAENVTAAAPAAA